MNEILPKIEEILPILSEDLSKIETATEKEIPIDDIASEMKNFVKAQIQIAGFLMDSGIRSLSNIHETAEYYNDKLQPTLNRASQILARVDRIFATFGKMFQSLENLTGKRGIFQPAITRNKNFRTKISNYQATVMRASAALNRGETLSEEILGKVSSGANMILQEYAEFKDFFAETIEPKFEQVTEKFQEFIQKAHDASVQLQAEIPNIQEKIEKISTAAQNGNEKIEKILSHWQEIENAILKLQKISNSISDERIEELLGIMLLDPENEKNFFRHPVEIISESLFSSPNYGSSIAPFFTVLALWVGALLATSMLSVRSTEAENQQKIRAGFVARMMVFVTIGLGQATAIVLGNIFVFHVYIVHPIVLFFTALLIITFFHIFIFSLVYLIGNAGKVLAILILLLQLSAGSGTFPVELTNDFFVKVHPFIPFTYAINAMREASLGMVESIFYYNIFILILMMLIVFFVAFLLAPKLSRVAIKSDNRTKGIDIFSH